MLPRLIRAVFSSSRQSPWPALAPLPVPPPPHTRHSSHPGNKRSHSSSNLLNAITSGKQHANLGTFTAVTDSQSAANNTGSVGPAAHPGNKRRQSQASAAGEDGQHHSHASAGSSRIGPKRKSKVGISGLGGHGHGHGHHHVVHGMTRKNNSSSTALAAKREKARSHASLANLAGEMAAAYTETEPATTAIHKQKQKHRANEEQEEEVEGEGDTGWISANSSAAVSPESGNSPVSPESMKALEFGKKNRRAGNKGKNAAVAALPELNFDKQQVKMLPSQSRQMPAGQAEDEVEDAGNVLGTTPKQGDGSLGLPPLPSTSSSGLSQSMRNDESRTSLSTIVQKDDGDITPLIEKNGEEGGFRLPEDTSARTSHPIIRESPTQLQPVDQAIQAAPKTSPSRETPVSELPELPTPNNRPRPSNLRKASSSTIRTMVSQTGGATRPPFTPGMRKSTLALQPRLDTKVEGLGEILEQNISPSSVTASGSKNSIEQVVKGNRNDVAFPSTSASQQGEGSSSRPTRHGRSISGSTNKAGTLTAQEAEDLARRLRSVSGTDLKRLDTSGSLRSISGNNNSNRDARSALRRSASSSLGQTLAGMTGMTSSSGGGQSSPRAEVSGSGGALGTLKRASGYFGSIGRLAGLAGLTSLSSDTSNSPPTSPILGTSSRRSPNNNNAAGTQSPAQAALLQNSPSMAGGSSNTLGRNKGKQVSANTAANIKAAQQQYRPPPLISKFIDTSQSRRMAFADSSMSGGGAGGNNSGISESTGGRDSRTRTVSRARAKMMTQRDAPFPYSEYDDNTAPQTPTGFGSGRGSSSTEDLSSASASASHLNLRALSSSRPPQGTTTPNGNQPLAKEVQRWILALAKEAERIDREHASNMRWRDELNASIARVLMKKEKEEEEDRREREKEIEAMRREEAAKTQAQAGKTSRPNSIRSKTMR